MFSPDHQVGRLDSNVISSGQLGFARCLFRICTLFCYFFYEREVILQSAWVFSLFTRSEICLVSRSRDSIPQFFCFSCCCCNWKYLSSAFIVVLVSASTSVLFGAARRKNRHDGRPRLPDKPFWALFFRLGSISRSLLLFNWSAYLPFLPLFLSSSSHFFFREPRGTSPQKTQIDLHSRLRAQLPGSFIMRSVLFAWASSFCVLSLRRVTREQRNRQRGDQGG